MWRKLIWETSSNVRRFTTHNFVQLYTPLIDLCSVCEPSSCVWHLSLSAGSGVQSAGGEGGRRPEVDHRQGYLTITAAGKRCRRNVQYCSLTMQSNFHRWNFHNQASYCTYFAKFIAREKKLEILSQIYCRGAPNRVWASGVYDDPPWLFWESRDGWLFLWGYRDSSLHSATREAGSCWPSRGTARPHHAMNSPVINF